MISVTSLSYFCAVAEERSFSKASKKLFISQQALSTHIAKIEAYYKIQLFDRGSPLTLTEPGRILLKYANSILSQFDDFAREIQDIKDFNQGELTLGIPVTRGTVMLPPLLSAFHSLFPQIKLNLQEGGTEEVIELMKEGSVDLYIGYRPDNCDGLAVTNLFEERFLVILPKKFLPCVAEQLPVLARGGPISIGWFAAVPFVAQKESTMNGQVFKQLCARAGMTPNVLMTTQNLITLVTLSLEGIGACTIPSTFISSQPQLHGFGDTLLFNNENLSRINAFELDSTGVGSFQIVICRRENKLLTRAGQEFIRLTQKLYRELPVNQILPQLRYESGQ